LLGAVLAKLNHPIYVGIDIGGTKCAVVISDEQLQILDRTEFATDVVRGAEQIINQLLDVTADMLSPYQADRVRAIGISCGGPLDSKRGVILSPPNLPGWDKIQIVDIFTQRFKVNTALQNDANAGALAEWMLGAGRGADNLVFLTFGSGLGAGLILDGRLYSGSNDLAGELGHWRLSDDGPVGFGKPGSFEGFCSGNGITKLAKTRIRELLHQGKDVSFCPTLESVEQLTTKSLAEAAKQGDDIALALFAESGKRLGQGLSLVIDLLNPEKIIIGSVFARCQSLIHPCAAEVIAQEAITAAADKCQILPAELGEKIGDLASLCIARYCFEQTA
jgi:glucokinase